MDRRHRLAAIGLRVLKGVLGDAAARRLGDQLDRLDDAGDDLKIKRKRLDKEIERFDVTSCSMPLYSPSVFSRIVTMSTSSYSVL